MKISSPSPLESQLDPLSTQFLTSLVSHHRQQIDTPPTHPCQNKRHSGLRMKMRPNQDVRWDAKKYASGHAIGVRQSLSRAQSPKHYLIACTRKQDILLPGVPKHHLLAYASKQDILFPGVPTHYESYCCLQEVKCFAAGCSKLSSYCSLQEQKALLLDVPNQYLIALGRNQEVLLASDTRHYLILLSPRSKIFL